MHATDPNFGEPQLGKTASKGCVRISNKLNEFLDIFGILDKDYERNNNLKKVQSLLRKDRKPLVFQGSYLIVGNSAERARKKLIFCGLYLINLKNFSKLISPISPLLL